MSTYICDQYCDLIGSRPKSPQNLAMYITTNVLLVVGDVISKCVVAGSQMIYVTKHFMGDL